MMSQAGSSQATFASGRYSKRKRTQVNYCMEEMEVDNNDTESEEDTLHPKKQRKTTASRTLPERKIFPFLKLPAEIRNMVYTYALTDPYGINFIAVQRNKRRCVERVSQETLGSVSHRMPYCSNKIGDSIADAEDPPTSLAPSLLAVNKQIHQESCDILYGNELVFSDTTALYSFMINFGPASASYFKKMRLKGWGRGRTSKVYNNACFAVLIWATNLEKFYIDTNIGWYCQPKSAAQRVYRDAFPWLEAVGNAKSRFDAALDILVVAEESFARHYYSTQGVTNKERLRVFNTELSRNLGLQQRRVG